LTDSAGLGDSRMGLTTSTGLGDSTGFASTTCSGSGAFGGSYK
jgi:hypothetical protein